MRAATTLCILLLAFPTIAAENDLYDYEELTLNLHLKNTVNIIPESNAARVEQVTADLIWFPRESFRQRMMEVKTFPSATKEESSYRYTWQSPSSSALDLRLDATLRTSNEPLPVQQYIRFPISTLPSEIAQYTREGELIDFNDDIRDQALSLAAGQEDLFQVVYAVADWVTTNIEYNLTTIAADATQPSSWVMEHRTGVCDEMTALFISMLRSLGIPARFVSGISYTNLPEFPEPWGGHGWAEVWFPDTGWVPFDVTYGTYGYIDATHIKLQDTFDARSNSIEFTMTARDANLMTSALDVDVEVLDKRHKAQELFTVTLKPVDTNVALDSYNVITATITNEKSHYVSARFQLVQTENVEIVSPKIRNILLRPFETRKLHYLVKTDNLKDGFYYTFPMKLYVGLREIAVTSFEARRGNPSHPKEFFSQYLEVEQTEKEYNKDVNFECHASPSTAYVDEELIITCSLQNEGNAILQGVTTCVDHCERLDIDRYENATLTRTVTCEQPGMASFLATAENRLINKYALVRYDCLDEATVIIDELRHPDSLMYTDRGQIDFRIRKGSEAVPKDVSIKIIHDNFEQVWESDDLIQPQRFAFSFEGKHLDTKDNTIQVLITYRDDLGRQLHSSREFTVEANNFTTGQKFMVHMYNIQRWIESFF